MQNKIAFEIIEPDDYVINRIKKRYKIYFNSRIEGFGDRCLVINYVYPEIISYKGMIDTLQQQLEGAEKYIKKLEEENKELEEEWIL